MKEFLVGLLALFILALMLLAYYLLFPFFMILAFFLRVLIVIFIGIFSIWLLGKAIIVLFNKIENKG